MLLDGKTAVITGCNRGIGRAILENFAQNGAKNVFAVIRKESEAFNTLIADLSQKHGVVITPVYADFRDEETVKTAAKEIIAAKIPVDVLVCNAGVGLPLSSLAMTKMEMIKEVFEINFFSQMLLTQLIARSMMRQKSMSDKLNDFCSLLIVIY